MSFLQDYLHARAMAASPEYADEHNQGRREEYLTNLMGQAPVPALEARTFEGPVRTERRSSAERRRQHQQRGKYDHHRETFSRHG